MTPRCGQRWFTIDGPATAHHTCIRRPQHQPQPCLCACGGTPPPRAGP